METNTELSTLIENSMVEIETAKSLHEAFLPFYEQALDWNKQAKTIVVTDATQLTEMKQAREARLALKAIRISVENRRKTLKEDSLRKGKAIDGVANLLKALIEPTEAYLQEQEDFTKIAEANRKEKLKIEREQLLQPFGITTAFYKLDEMDEETFKVLYSNAKLSFERKIEEEKKAEEERIAREQEALKEQERIRIENEELKRKQAEQERLLREERMKAEEERKANEEKLKREREEAEKKLAEEKARAEAEAKLLREEQERKLAAERVERQRVEAELKAKQEAEERAKQEAEAAEELELSKGDADKFQDFLTDLENLKAKYIFKSKKYKTAYAQGVELLNKTINFLISKQ